ncbi:hypothetical protein [Methanobrevibacter olleyae]|uniref:Uncharacterized protein n=1 Tax=Methanobrevibacter olleyae TaxID=294671 RepID=A0A126R1E6_METOL|nr:hypothetical protein [Methanobrevibacter olleyae]AMK15897.1 hypothetical protein YLM1_1340 [Methanobrevibacter olleyae]
MKLPSLNLAFISRFFIMLAIVLWIYNEFYLKSDLLEIISLICASLSIISMVIFAIRLKQGKYNQSFQIVVETDVDRALKDGVISKKQADSIQKRFVLDTKDLLLNVIFNFAIANHFDLIPVEILHDILPNVPTAHLMYLYEESREISDDLNDYFRSQKFANKADVITRCDEIKEYLAKTYPWMAPDTLDNTYDYFFLGIGNG